MKRQSKFRSYIFDKFMGSALSKMRRDFERKNPVMDARGKHRTGVIMLQHEDTRSYDLDESEMTDIRELMYEEKAYECETWKQEALAWKDLYHQSVRKIMKFAVGDT